ncbi:hypothetical protein EX895_006547 [Sporisorium graminicola]|uniref:AB hydrolase-1 domain-containing protein n=1 Tax=Sporisorium graminicola TaxID=280036 RepID=A0A4U7KKJ2_9BASI|nr:hypothetical protein EX895_006547 [Sporisorium graminicola]TKY84645.1 hypothetical protein EX895_006547 [Sporisorium graminicola]
MRASATPLAVALATLLASLSTLTTLVSAEHVRFGHHNRHMLSHRDASTLTAKQKGSKLGYEEHTTPKVPSGARLTSISVGTGTHKLAVYWTRKPANGKAKQAFVMIHGRNRNGGDYWQTMNSVLKSAVKDKFASADANAIIVAPEFYSKKLNSGQYKKHELAWDDVNAWQAGEAAIHPKGAKESSFDALDVFFDEFSNTTKYPKLEELVFVGHGGGGQLINRYGIVAKDMSSKALSVRFIAGDPSSSAYFTEDRPTTNAAIASKATCPLYNTWRYGFTNFTGTLDGLKTPRQYFAQNVKRDVRYIVGYNDTAVSGDQYCMAILQGGVARRDRNLAWWKYINMLARTNEDVSGLPGNLTRETLPDWSDLSGGKLAHTLTVIEGATHNADQVFNSQQGRTVLFEKQQGKVQRGWRPKGYNVSGVASGVFTTTSGSASAARVTSSAGGVSQQQSNSQPTSGSTSSNKRSSTALVVATAMLAAVAAVV